MKTRILLASMVFDSGSTHSSMYEPVISIYFDFLNEQKPIHIVCKYKWSGFELRYKFNDTIKKLFTDGGLIQTCKEAIQENIPEYTGKLTLDINDDFYLSPKGREIGFVKDFDSAKKLYSLK